LLVVTSNPTEDRQYATLADACRIAISGDVIELRYDGRLDHPEKPITIADRKLTIRGGEGFQPIVRFRPTGPDRVLYPRSMIHVAGGELLLSNVHLELEIPVQVRSENWSLFETVLANRIRLLDCAMTIRNADGNHAALYQNVSFFHTKAAPQRVRTTLGDVQEPLPRLQLQLRDCVARGEAALLRGSALDTVQLQWDNGLVAISEPFVVLQGQSASLPLGAQLEIDLKHVTCLARSGFCRMLSSEDQRHLPTVRFDCTDSILIMANTPLVDQVGAQTADEFKRLVLWNAANNFYENVSEYWHIDGGRNSEVVSMRWGNWQDFWGPGRERNDRPMPVLWRVAADPETPLSEQTLDAFVLDESDANPARAAASDGSSDAGMQVDRLPRLRHSMGTRLSESPEFPSD
jgi:hypothetical protein